MTTQPEPAPVGTFNNIPPVDPGNPILSETPVIWSTVQVDTPRGRRLAITLRTTSTTLTLLLERDHAVRLGADITREATHLSTLVVPNGILR